MFFQAEFDMEKKPEDALAAFETVIEMEQQEQECNYQFKALKNMVILYAQKGKEEESRNKLKQLLKICHKVTQNDSRDTLNYILDQLTRILSPASMEGIYEEVMAYLKASNEKLWQSVCMRLCRIYLEKKKYKQLDELAEQLKVSMRGPDGAYDEKKGSPFEVLALQMQMYAEVHETRKLKVLHSEAIGLSGVVTDARVNAMLKECGAMIYLSDKNWENAQADLLESFKSYQQLANPKAKQMLKLLLVTSMVGGSEINPMTLSEAKVYQEDIEVGPIANLRKAYENNQIAQLKSIMTSHGRKLADDKDIKEYAADFFKAIKQKILVEKIMSYTSVSIGYLARDIGVDDAELKALLVELILDERIDGKIDESKGLFEVRASERDNLEAKRYAALERMANTMSTTFTGIIDSICS